MSGSRPPLTADRFEEEGVFVVADPPNSGRWWIPVAIVATVVPVTALLLGVASVAGSYLPVGGRLLLPLYWAVVVGSWLFSPLALHYDQLYVAARTGHVPSAYYYAVFVPGLGTLVAAAYLVHRYRLVALD